MMIAHKNAKWRLIIDPAGNGAWNMAMDEAILEFVAGKIQIPTLRLYAWKPFCLSLGHAQTSKDVDMPALTSKGWSLVRRPTGGKAILHADEITYSITAPIDEPRVKGTVIESYQRLSRAFLSALRFLGIQANARPKEPSYTEKPINPICFETPSDFEITSNGKKIIGSAQARRIKGVLQHGSIPLNGDISRIVEVLTFSSPEERLMKRDFLKERACTLFDVKKQEVSWNMAAEAIIKGFSEELDINFVQEKVNQSELEKANDLVSSKYGNDSWTLRI